MTSQLYLNDPAMSGIVDKIAENPEAGGAGLPSTKPIQQDG
jgi:hypothetical protein